MFSTGVDTLGVARLSRETKVEDPAGVAAAAAAAAAGAAATLLLLLPHFFKILVHAWAVPAQATRCRGQ